MTRLAAVTGANRGIGLSICKHLKSRGYNVIGTCRTKTPEMEALKLEIVEGVDVGRDGGCAALASAVGSRKVDVLVCNAGILREDSLHDVDIEKLREQFEVNSLGPLRTYLAVKDKLGAGSKVAIITSRMGSIADNGSGGDYGYRMSKAAVNMLGANLAVDLKKQGVAVGILHPGFVATDMTKQYWGMNGVIDTEKSATDLVKIIEEQLTMDTTGTFWHRDGSILPW